MISAVARLWIATESPAIVGITRGKRSQTVGREQFPFHNFQYPQGEMLFKHWMRKADCENLVGADGSVRSVFRQHVVQASSVLVPEDFLESGLRSFRQRAIVRSLILI